VATCCKTTAGKISGGGKTFARLALRRRVFLPQKENSNPSGKAPLSVRKGGGQKKKFQKVEKSKK